MKKFKKTDLVFDAFTLISALLTALFLGTILYFIFSKGSSLLNLSLITSDYHAKHYNGVPSSEDFCACDLTSELDEGVYYSSKTGIALYNDHNRAGNIVIKVAYIHPMSPLRDLININDSSSAIGLQENTIISRIAYQNGPSSLTRNGAERMVDDLDSGLIIRDISFSTLGGGIRGSLIATLYLIGLTLLIAMPIGIMTAIYLNEFAPANKITHAIRSFIETLTGVPSIIYGLLGITLFVPLVIKMGLASGPSLYAGAMTLAVILLPVVIRTTEESLKAIPLAYRHASLALGGNYTQTVFKVVLPNALPGILTASFLAIGRIIGESAALIFVLGTAVKDHIRIDESATPLAVHIWSMMTDEPANIELSSTIAIIILMVVFVLNIGTKLTVHRLHKKTR